MVFFLHKRLEHIQHLVKQGAPPEPVGVAECRIHPAYDKAEFTSQKQHGRWRKSDVYRKLDGRDMDLLHFE